jgi:hypothetical protein
MLDENVGKFLSPFFEKEEKDRIILILLPPKKIINQTNK